MDHRHLLPDEIDLLLDNEEGFGVQPLRAHVRGCAECRAELEDARAVVAELEHLPHLVPSRLFADRVMANVQVFEPWHVAALDTARRWVPRSRPARVIGGAFAAGLASMLTIGQPALDVLRANGAIGITVALTALLAAIGVAAAGLRVMAVTSRRRRS